MRVNKNTLRELIKEVMQLEDSTGLPRPNDLARKLSAAGPNAAMKFLSQLLELVDFGAPAPPPAPVEIEELPPPPLVKNSKREENV